MKPPALLFISLLAACGGGNSTPVDTHELGSIDYQMPTTWDSAVRDRGARQVVEWTPKRNDRKESIAVLHSEALPALTKAGPSAVRHYLVTAQAALKGSFSAPKRFTTKSGLVGERIEGSFRPANTNREYTRTHAVVLVGDHLVHLLYTAPLGTANRDVFESVIDSLQRKGA